MSLTNTEKLEFLGFQFWQKKPAEGFDAKKTIDYFVVIRSILFCFSNNSLLDNSFDSIERFIVSIARALNSQEPCKFLDSVPQDISVKKVIYFGESDNKELLGKNFPDANFMLLASFKDLFSNSQLKKDLWLSIKD